MKKNAVAKGILSVVFVAAAGICYLCAAKAPGGGQAELVLQKEAETLPDKEESVQDDTEELGENGNLEKSAPAGEEQNLLNSGNTEENTELVYVHVCGAVKEPGVYALPAGSRTSDAVLCAGGFLSGAAQDYLNLATRISDGQKIYVPDETEAERLREEEVPAGMPEGNSTYGQNTNSYGEEEQDGTARVNLNTAGVNELMTLPGIGKAKAEAILAYRNEHGAFSSCEELMEVPGIKENIYENLCENITVGK